MSQVATSAAVQPSAAFTTQLNRLRSSCNSLHERSVAQWEQQNPGKPRLHGLGVMGIVCEDDNESSLVPLNKCFGMSIVNRVPRPGSGRERVDGVIAASPFAYIDGKVICGTPWLRVSSASRSEFKLAEEGKEPAGFKLAGNLRNVNATLQERGDHAVVINPARKWDARLLAWADIMMSTVTSGHSTPGSYITPDFLSIVPGNSVEWLTVRRGNELEYRLVDIINRRAWTCDNVRNTLGADGRVVFVADGNLYKGKEKGDENEQDIVNPSSAFRAQLMLHFGLASSLEFFPLIQGEKNVAASECLWTPILQQSKNPKHDFTVEEVRALPQYEELMTLAALCSFIEIDGRRFSNVNFAYGRQQPYVFFAPSYPRVQLIDGRRTSFAAFESGVKIDMLNVPHRSAVLRKGREQHRQTPAAAPTTTEAQKTEAAA